MLSRGRVASTTAELAQLLGVPDDQVRRRLHAPAQRGEWVMPVRGLWVPVRPEYRTWGAPPGIELIDLMMRHLEAPYYVGWLTAAGVHGAAHQAPQVFQVATDRAIRDRVTGRTRFTFARRMASASIPTIAHPTQAGSARVSTIAATALDIATDVAMSGGLDNAATVIVELAEADGFRIDLVTELASGFPAASVRRVGYVLENFGSQDLDLENLLASTRSGATAPSRLDPGGPAAGPVDLRWNLYLNREIDPDL